MSDTKGVLPATHAIEVRGLGKQYQIGALKAAGGLYDRVGRTIRPRRTDGEPAPETSIWALSCIGSASTAASTYGTSSNRNPAIGPAWLSPIRTVKVSNRSSLSSVSPLALPGCVTTPPQQSSRPNTPTQVHFPELRPHSIQFCQRSRCGPVFCSFNFYVAR